MIGRGDQNRIFDFQPLVDSRPQESDNRQHVQVAATPMVSSIRGAAPPPSPSFSAPLRMVPLPLRYFVIRPSGGGVAQMPDNLCHHVGYASVQKKAFSGAPLTYAVALFTVFLVFRAFCFGPLARMTCFPATAAGAFCHDYIRVYHAFRYLCKPGFVVSGAVLSSCKQQQIKCCFRTRQTSQRGIRK